MTLFIPLYVCQNLWRKTSCRCLWLPCFLIVLLIGHVACGDRRALIQLSSGAEIPGKYANLGAADSIISGILHEVGNCTKKSLPDGVDQDAEWIAVISLPEVDEPEHQKRTAQSTTCTILEQVKQAMLLGGSALLILALKPVIFKQLDLQFHFKGPVILVTRKKDIESVQKDMSNSKSLKATISPVHEDSQVLAMPRLTLWSTCGKSSGGTHREWEGTVCLGGSFHENHVSYSALWQLVFSGIVSLYLLFRYQQWRRPFHVRDDVEDSLQRLAKFSVSRMPTKRYKKKKKYIGEPDKDCCAICLEEFFHGQLIRMLPCFHHFHSKCVDVWLIKKRTCPLCKLDIVDQRFSCSSSINT